MLVNNARNLIASWIVGDGLTPAFNAANCRLGVGDSSTAAAATQTDLQAATNKLRKVLDTGYPVRVNNAITMRTTFLKTEAVWAWNERGVFNAASGAASMLSRRVVNYGTKPNTVSWVLTCTDTVVLV